MISAAEFAGTEMTIFEQGSFQVPNNIFLYFVISYFRFLIKKVIDLVTKNVSLTIFNKINIVK